MCREGGGGGAADISLSRPAVERRERGAAERWRKKVKGAQKSRVSHRASKERTGTSAARHCLLYRRVPQEFLRLPRSSARMPTEGPRPPFGQPCPQRIGSYGATCAFTTFTFKRLLAAILVTAGPLSLPGPAAIGRIITFLREPTLPPLCSHVRPVQICATVNFAHDLPSTPIRLIAWSLSA